jgi:hypothetical protein
MAFNNLFQFFYCRGVYLKGGRENRIKIFLEKLEPIRKAKIKIKKKSLENATI